jgi:glycosyltransferase involved in cell wall biosynthesis
MQMYTPLSDAYEIAGFVSRNHYFNVGAIPVNIHKLFSVGMFLRARILRKPMIALMGDYHDLQGLERALPGFDIVHCSDSMYYFTYQAAKAKKSCGFKLALTIWENIPFLHHNHAAAEHKKIIFDRTDLFLAVSERAKEVLILEGAPSEKITVLMPGIDIGHFIPMSKDPDLLRQFNCHEDDFIVLYVANLFREKGIFDLLVAFRSLLNRRGSTKTLKLLIAGRGKERENVSRWIEMLQLTQNVFLIGSHPYAIMPKIHNLADVFVLPSIPIPGWQEQFGYVLAESMACGKPVISTLSGSIPEVVGDSGMLIQPNDFISITRAIEELLDDEQLRKEYGMRARQNAEKRFDARVVSQKLRTLFNGL